MLLTQRIPLSANGRQVGPEDLDRPEVPIACRSGARLSADHGRKAERLDGRDRGPIQSIGRA